MENGYRTYKAGSGDGFLAGVLCLFWGRGIGRDLVMVFLVGLVFLSQTGYSQVREYATWLPSSGTTGSNLVLVKGVDNPGNAGNNSNISYAEMIASTVNVLGVGLSGGAWLQLKFPSNRTAGATTYVRIDEPSATGLNLGEIIGLPGTSIVGSFYIGATNSTGSDAAAVGNLVSTTSSVRIVTDEFGSRYLALTPGQSAIYNSVRISLSYPAALLGVGTIRMRVYNAFTLSGYNACSPVIFTELGRSQGINLTITDLVRNPVYAIDANSSNFSEIQLGALGVGSKVSQVVYFPALSEQNSILKLRLQINSAAVNLSLMGAYRVKAYRGNTLVYDEQLNNGLASGLNVLGLLSGGGIVSLQIPIANQYDRIELEVSSTINLAVGAGIRLYEVSRISAICPPPVFTPSPLNDPICANSTLVAVRNTDEPTSAVDVDFDSYATIRSDAGVLLGIGSNQGFLEVEFNSVVPVGKTTLIRIDYDRDVLDALLGGSLSGVLANLVNGLVLGNHYFEVQLKNGATTILTTSSANGFSSSNGQVKIVQDQTGRYYIAVTTNTPYSNIRLTDHTNAILGVLSSDKFLKVYNICYENTDGVCNPRGAYTTYDGGGVSLDLLRVNELVSNPEYAIDANPGTFSRISLGVLGINASTEQLVYFDTPIRPGNDILVSLGIEGVSLLNLDLFNSIEFRLYSANGIVRTVLANDLIGLDLLGLFNSGASYDFPISLTDDDPPISRIGVRISSLVSAGLLNANLKFSGVTANPTPPSVEDQISGGDYQICQGNSRLVSVDPPLSSNSQMTWYTDQSGTNILNNGNSYNIPDNLEPGEYTYYVRSSLAGCSQRSLPTEINVRVEPSPNQNDIGIDFQGGYFDAGLNRYIYQAGIEQVEIAPNYSVIPGGSFTWYSDLEGQHPLVLNEPDANGAIFSVNAITGKLIITNTSMEVEDYELFVGYVTPSGCKTVKPITLENFIILPLQIHKFEVEARESREVNLIWELSNEQQQGTVTVQRALANLEFVDLDNLPIVSGEGRFRMNFTDFNPLPGRNYYRLLIGEENSNSVFYSEVRMAEVGEFEGPAFMVFPSPFGSSFTVRSTVDLDTPVVASLLNTNGVVIRQVQMESLSYGERLEFRELGNLPAGVYILRMETARGSRSYRLIK
ncbi:T9SS type A sorting domain-containing protein [Algoriphagus sp.]|uniref:T9SS type A sorting domain-containing protein n=1 Tax=Algoriphagus sp. TaxID=1872435 RepID=UPI003F6EDC29